MSEAGSRKSSEFSETSSQQKDLAILKKRSRLNAENANQDEDDLLEQKRSLQEGIFASMYMLAKSKTADSWKFAALKICLEGLTAFLVVFNTTMGWDIHTGNPLWQAVRWVLPRSPVARLWGYNTYVKLMYVVIAFIYLVVGCIAALTVAMRRQEHSKWLVRSAKLLQMMTDVCFSIFYISIFDFLLFLFDCDYAGKNHHAHNYWPEVQCFSSPHIIHMVVAGVTAVVFFCSTALMLVAGCDLNPLAHGIMASPAAVMRLKVLVLKALYVISANTLVGVYKVQAVLLLVWVAFITYYNVDSLPFLNLYVNYLWVGNWVGVLYTCTVYAVLLYGKERLEESYRRDMTMVVLYGVFPAVLLGVVLAALRVHAKLRSAAKFRSVPPDAKLHRVHKFSSPEEVELLARSMRHFDSEGVVLPESADLGEMIIKCGMALFPANVFLLVVYANFVLEARKDGPAARTQLQLALKAGPSTLQRYQIFSTIENSKRLKDGQEGQLDLQSYVEFKRNYRAVIRVHKSALAAQREFWQLMQRSSVRMSAVEKALRHLEEEADTAHQVYKRVLERYPANGKLLRCYGKFLEDVRDDPVAAARAYTEAARNGGGDVLMSLDLGLQGGDKPEFLTTMDLHEDACIVINAEGTILMCNTCVTPLLGYLRSELEGANVSVIMPQPFAGRHAGYLSRYAEGGEPHMLDSVRDVVGLHKERYVFPLQICVTKLSGVGADAIFLGCLRPAPLDAHNLRAWVTPGGVILCTDPQFASLTGMAAEEMIGRPFQSLTTDTPTVESLLQEAVHAPQEALADGKIAVQTHIAHKYLPPVPVEVHVSMGGTDLQRIFVLNARRTDGNNAGLMVVDTKGALTFATWDVAAMLGYPLDRFLKMKLDQLLPQPFATMHATKHLRDQPQTVPSHGCRAGRVVHLVNSAGAHVPVRLGLSSRDDGAGRMQHVVEVGKVDMSSDHLHADRRLSLLCTMSGAILSVDLPESSLFGWPAGVVVGSNLADCIDVFKEWRDKAGAQQMELLLLSLLDREAEMPGTSWRVRVHSPDNDATLPAIDPRAPLRSAQGRSACLQTEIVEGREARKLLGAAGVEGQDANEDDDTASIARIILWRRDLLTGVVELDERLVVRRGDVTTGLIVGLPASALARTPLYRLLDVPRGSKWDELMAAQDGGRKAKKSALKAGAAGPVVSGVCAFLGPHPDGGTMRIMLQGVTGAASGRIFATLHPDTNYQGARANVYRALGLEALMRGMGPHGHGHGHEGGHGAVEATPYEGAHAHAATEQRNPPSAAPHSPPAARQQRQQAETEAVAKTAAGANGGGDLAGGAAGGDGQRAGTGSQGDGGAQPGARSAEEDADAPDGDADAVSSTGAGGSGDADVDGQAEGARLHKRASSKSEFVAQWVRTLSKQVSGEVPPGAGTGARKPPSGDLPAVAEEPAHVEMPQPGHPDGAVGSARGLRSRGDGDGAGLRGQDSYGSRRFSKALSGVTADDEAAAEGQLTRASTGDHDAASSTGDDDEGTSQGLGAAFTDASSAADVDVTADARRTRLLKRLTRTVCGPHLVLPLARMRLRTLLLLLGMLAMHVVTYIVFVELITKQYNNIREVHRLALAADRAQVVTVKASIVDFCSTPGVAPDSVCERPYGKHLADLNAALDDLEQYHQETYLGIDAKPRKIREDTAYDMWTKHDQQPYDVYLDTAEPRWIELKGGVWQLGNRFIAAGRELLYWGNQLAGQISHLRAYQFLYANGPGSLFHGYTASLDFFVKLAWDEVSRLQTGLIILLLVEVLAVQLGCVAYEYVLVRGVEAGRAAGMLVALGVPGPMLRVLASRPLVVLEDTDDEEDGDDEDGGDGGRSKASGAAAAASGGDTRRGSTNGSTGADQVAGTACGVGDKELVVGQQQQMGVSTKRGSDGSVAREDADAHGRGVHGQERSAGVSAALPQQQQQQLLWDGEGDSEGEGEAEGNGVLVGAKRGVAAGVRHGSGGGMQINGKLLLPSRKTRVLFLLPLSVWLLALVVIGVVSYVRLEGMQGPLASLNMASHVVYRYTRVRMIAFLLVAARDPALRQQWREALSLEVKYLGNEYETLMYGGLAATQVGTVFQHEVPASTFESVSFSANFFREHRCFRWDQSLCYKPDSPYYEVTHHGLDVMLRRILSEMALLVADADEDATYNGTRYTTMYAVGTKDLYEGLQSSTELFVDFSISRYNTIKLINTVFLVVTVAIFFGYALFLLRPYKAKVEREACRLAGLLSHVPAEMDVTAHARQVVRSYGRLKARRPNRNAVTDLPLGQVAGSTAGL